MKKVIVITGSSTGFGALMVKTFSAVGHTVIATMRNITSRNKTAAESLGSLPGVEVVELDVADDRSIKAAVAKVLDKYQKIDVLINNAAVYGTGILEAYSLVQVKKIFDVNVYGVLRVLNEVLPSMRKAQEGLIINISSGVGRISPPFQVPYNASKFALEGIVEGSYGELIGQGIENVIIEPGAFGTELWEKVGVHADRQQITDSYGADTAAMSKAIGDTFTNILQTKKPDPQLVADAAIRLVNMPKGQRPLRTPVDPSANSLDIEYNNSTSEIKGRWMAQYGF